jgi:phage/plasmid-like protein (TIGR03299 family)
MAHQLETWGSGQSASFVSAREHAWHRLGVVLPGTFDAAQAMEHAKLGGWNVRKEALQTVAVIDDHGVSPSLPVPDQFATVRTNPVTGGTDVLGVVGAGYLPIQNEAHAALLDSVVDESGAHFETAGSLRGGRSVFLSMKLPNTMQVGGIDPVDLYLIALNSHDGTSAFRLMVAPVRVVCANTQALAVRRAQSTFSIRHTSGAHGHIAQAREALGLTFKFAEAFQAEADRMIAQSITDDQFMGIVGKLWDAPASTSARSRTISENRTGTLRQLFRASDTNEAIRGTRWAAYQAVTEYTDHFAPISDKGNPTLARAERVAASGSVTALKTKAFELIAAL